MADRRKHHKVVALGVENIVTELLAKGATYEQIESNLRAMGKDISASSVRRYNNDITRKLEKLTRTHEAADAICKVMKDVTGEEVDSNMSDMLAAVLQHTILDRLGDDELSTKDIVGLSIAGSNVIKSKTGLEKLKETERKRMRRTWEKVTAEAKMVLERSDLWPQVEAVLVAGMKQALEQA